MKRTSNIVVGVFDDRTDAEEALQALKAAGFKPDHIDVAALQTPEPQGVDHAAGGRRSATRVDETTGILAGGILGGLAGWLIAASTVAVPGRWWQPERSLGRSVARVSARPPAA